jgi:hypothetical protein
MLVWVARAILIFRISLVAAFYLRITITVVVVLPCVIFAAFPCSVTHIGAMSVIRPTVSFAAL